MLGAAEVGMLKALAERDIAADLVIGTSVGALNGLAVAARPGPDGVAALEAAWGQAAAREVFSSSIAGQVSNLVRYGTHLHSDAGLRRLVTGVLGRADADFEDLAVPFQCVAACIETAGAEWFSSGPVVDAVVASCAVPGLLPPSRIGGRHYLDGGLVASVPVGRAVALGARRIFVLQVGRLERQLKAPTRPWEVALVAFEIARRHQFADDLARMPDSIEVHILPAGDTPPSLTVGYRRTTSTRRRIDAAYDAAGAYLDDLAAGRPVRPG